MMGPDGTINAASHGHIININAGHHQAITRLREENTELLAHTHKLEGLLSEAVRMLAHPEDFTREERWAFVNHVQSEGWVAA